MRQKTVRSHVLLTVTALLGPKRYAHLVKSVVIWKKRGGYMRMDGPWPPPATARWCFRSDLPRRTPSNVPPATGRLPPTAIPLDDLVEELLPKLKSDGILPGAFYTPADKGATPGIDQLDGDLAREAGNC